MKTNSVCRKLTFVSVTLFTLCVFQNSWGQIYQKSQAELDADRANRQQSYCNDQRKLLDDAQVKLAGACAKAGLNDWQSCSDRVELCQGLTEQDPTDQSALFFADASDDQSVKCSDMDKKEKADKVKDLQKDLKDQKKEIDDKTKDINSKQKDNKKDLAQLNKELNQLEEDHQKDTRDSNEAVRKANMDNIKAESEIVSQVGDLNMSILDSQAQINIELANKAGALSELTSDLINTQCIIEVRTQLNQKNADKQMTSSGGGLIRASGEMAKFKENLTEACYEKMMAKRSAITTAADSKIAALNQKIDTSRQQLAKANQQLATFKAQVQQQQQEAQQKNQQDQVNYLNKRIALLKQIQDANEDMQKEQNQNNLSIMNEGMELRMKNNELAQIQKVPAGSSSVGQVIELGGAFSATKTSVCDNWSNSCDSVPKPNNCNLKFTDFNSDFMAGKTGSAGSGNTRSSGGTNPTPKGSAK